MGLIPPYEMAWVVNAVELSLSRLGVRKFDGTASKVFTESFFGVEN